MSIPNEDDFLKAMVEHSDPDILVYIASLRTQLAEAKAEIELLKRIEIQAQNFVNRCPPDWIDELIFSKRTALKLLMLELPQPPQESDQPEAEEIECQWCKDEDETNCSNGPCPICNSTGYITQENPDAE